MSVMRPGHEPHPNPARRSLLLLLPSSRHAHTDGPGDSLRDPMPGRFSGDEHAHRHGSQNAVDGRRVPQMRRRPDRSARANRGADPVTPTPPDHRPNDPMSTDIDTSAPITDGATPAGTNAENQPDRGTVSVDRRMRKHPTAPRTNLTKPGGSQ